MQPDTALQLATDPAHARPCGNWKDHRRTAGRRRRRADLPAGGRPRAARRRSGPGQDHAAADALQGDAPEVFAHPVHARPDARRHRRQHDHRQRKRIQGSALLARPDLRAPGAGRRDQSRDAQDAVRAARGHAGTHRHQRHADHGTGAAVPGHGDAEPDRDGRNLSPSRSAARPLPDEDPGALPYARRAGHHRRTHQPERRDRRRAGAHARRNPGFARLCAIRFWSRRMCRITPSTW